MAVFCLEITMGRQKDLGPEFRRFVDDELDTWLDQVLDIEDQIRELKKEKERLGELALSRMQALNIRVYEARDGTPIEREVTEKVKGKRKRKRSKTAEEVVEEHVDNLKKSGVGMTVHRGGRGKKGKPN